MQTNEKRKIGYNCLYLTRPGEGVYIDKYFTSELSRVARGKSEVEGERGPAGHRLGPAPRRWQRAKRAESKIKIH